MKSIRKVALLTLLLALLAWGAAAAEGAVSVVNVGLSNSYPQAGERVTVVANAPNAYAYSFFLLDEHGAVVQSSGATLHSAWTFTEYVPGTYLARVYATDFVTDAYGDSPWFTVTGGATRIQPATVSGDFRTGGSLTAVMNAENALAYNYWLFDAQGRIVQERTNTTDTAWSFSVSAPGLYLLRTYATNFRDDGWADTGWFYVAPSEPVRVASVLLSASDYRQGDVLRVDAPVSGGTGSYAYNYWLFNDRGEIVQAKTNTLDPAADFPLQAPGVYLVRVYATDFLTEDWNDSPWFYVAPDDSLKAYLGDWERVDEDGCTLTLREQNGVYTLSASFYRVATFDATLVGWDSECEYLVFRTGYGDVCHLYLYSDMLELAIFPASDYGGYFDQSEFIYKRHEPTDIDRWLGVWAAADGEYFEVTYVSERGVLLTYHGLTASGDSYYHTDYELAFEDDECTVAAEDPSVIAQKGWRRVFILKDDRITMQSRYPDQDFYRQ